MRHFLVPTDFSEAAQESLEYAVQLCHELSGRITLLHVSHFKKVSESLTGLDAIENLSRAMDSPPSAGGYAPSHDFDEMTRVALQNLKKCINPSWSEKVTIETAFEEGRPSVKIVEYARDNKADMIVMGTHGRGLVAHFFLGSVAENVIRSADCPVLTVRGKKKTGT